jgi:4-amino-4-deoxy-L-arabinose transferase-like glycosyltransferase
LNNILKYGFWTIAFLLVILAWVFGLNIDLTGDSGLYAAISRQMVESGDWLNLKINGEPYDQKPHLFFWLAGLGIQLFGNSNWAFKLFPFLFGLSSIYFTYRLARLLYNELSGKLAALLAGTSQMFFLYFFDFHTDTVLQAAWLWQSGNWPNILITKNRRIFFSDLLELAWLCSPKDRLARFCLSFLCFFIYC